MENDESTLSAILDNPTHMGIDSDDLTEAAKAYATQEEMMRIELSPSGCVESLEKDRYNSVIPGKVDRRDVMVFHILHPGLPRRK